MDRPPGAPRRALELLGWRREVAGLYAEVRAEARPERAWERWRAGRDRLFEGHPESPLPPGDPLRASGLAYWPYDPGLRFELELIAPESPRRVRVETGEDGVTTLVLVGEVRLPPPLGASLGVWSLEPVRGRPLPPRP